MRYGYNHAVLERSMCKIDSDQMTAVRATTAYQSDWAMHEKEEAHVAQQPHAYRTRSMSIHCLRDLCE